MTRKKPPATVTITVDAFYDRVAWYQWKGCYQEANALCALAAWFTPPINVDENRIERRVQKYIADAQRQADPVN